MLEAKAVTAADFARLQAGAALLLSRLALCTSTLVYLITSQLRKASVCLSKKQPSASSQWKVPEWVPIRTALRLVPLGCCNMLIEAVEVQAAENLATLLDKVRSPDNSIPSTLQRCCAGIVLHLTDDCPSSSRTHFQK